MLLERLKLESSNSVYRYAVSSVSFRMTVYSQMGVVVHGHVTHFLNFGVPIIYL